MSRIKAQKTKPEEMVAKYLFSHGVRYRRNVKELPGKPDIVLRKYRTVIFINGCFWHMHECESFFWPESNAEFWRKKLIANKERDKRNYAKLQSLGWKIVLVWECELKHGQANKTLGRVLDEVKKNYG